MYSFPSLLYLARKMSQIDVCLLYCVPIKWKVVLAAAKQQDEAANLVLVYVAMATNQ